MKIWHRGHLEVEHEQFLKDHGIKHEPIHSVKNPEQIRKFMFEIDEENPAFVAIKRLLSGDHTYIGTKFTPNEIAQAEWSIVWANHSIDNVRCGNFAWSEEYVADLCKNCGTGWRQVAPFRIKKEPKLGKNVFANFGSAFELFCAPVVLEAFKKHGFSSFETKPLILNKEDCPAESLKQLIITEVAQPAVAEELVEHERYSQTDCPVCGRTWHAHYTRGALPLRRSALNPKLDFQLTNEWFGNGRTARREILFSRRAVNLALENNWQGIQFIPVKLV